MKKVKGLLRNVARKWEILEFWWYHQTFEEVLAMLFTIGIIIIGCGYTYTAVMYHIG